MKAATTVAESHAIILRDWYGRDCAHRLVSLDDQVWFVKCKDLAEKRRDILATLLASSWANVAETRILTNQELSQLGQLNILRSSDDIDGTYLVRFALDYRFDELPLQDMDTALAYELVFSAWVRRRDAHAFNRVYHSGVPVFFDFGTAFLGEPRLVDLDIFFRNGPDSGWAGLWRLWQCVDVQPDTSLMRRMEMASFNTEKGRVLLPVCSYDVFVGGLDLCERRIVDMSADQIEGAIATAGYTNADRVDIREFLLNSQRQLPIAVERLREIVLAV